MGYISLFIQKKSIDNTSEMEYNEDILETKETKSFKKR